MKKTGRTLVLVALIFALGCTPFLAGCSVSEDGRQAALKATEAAVETQVGAVEDYNGIVGPTLEANYVQTEAEAAKYGAEMERILKEGLGADRELQSGI